MSLPGRLFSWWGRSKRKPRSAAKVPQPRPQWWSRLSIHQNTFFRTPLERLLPTLQLAGIPGVGLWADRLSDWSTSEIVREVLPSGLQVSSIGPIGGFTRHNGYSFDEAVRDGLDRIDLAESLRASVVRIVSGPVAGHLNKHARRLLILGLKELLPAAQYAGVRLAIQPMSREESNWTFLHTLEAAESILGEINHPSLGLSINAAHFPATDDHLRLMERLAPWIAAVQLTDPKQSSDRYEQSLPDADSHQTAELIQALESVHYRGWYELEVWSRDLWKLESEILMERCQESLGCLVPATTPVDA